MYENYVFSLFLLLFAIIGAHTQSTLTTQDVLNEELELITEFTTKSHPMVFPDQTYTPLSTFNGATYFVWVNPNRHPMLAKIQDGRVDTARLDKSDSYQVLDNGHHRFSLGVDSIMGQTLHRWTWYHHLNKHRGHLPDA